VQAAEEEKSAKPKERGGRRLSLKKKDGFRFRFFCIFSDVVKIAPPLKFSIAWYL
jgi:hypothetical protein